MTWSLQVSRGDLALSGGSLGTVSNENKLLQDLRHYLLERMGTDDLHPGYGSLIDGGTLPSGRNVPSAIGGWDFRSLKVDIEMDIRRIAVEYQRRQLARAKSDRLRYNKTTLTPGEILAELSFIEFTQNEDALLVNIGVVSGSGQQVETVLKLDPVITN